MMENAFKVISQLGFVVEDLDKVKKQMKRIFNEEPIMARVPLKGRKYFGEEGDFEAEIAFYRFSNIELEFVKPLRGKSIWQDFLEKGRNGLHHIRFNVDNFDGVVDDMKEKGVEISMEGISSKGIEGLRWGYFDSEKVLPFIFEIFNGDEVNY